jgi:hypothetical protein
MPTANTMQNHARRVLAHQQGQTNGAGPAEEPDATALEAFAPDPSFAADLLPGTDYQIVKRVTIPAISIGPGAAIVCRILEAVHVSEVEDSRFGPARVCQIEAPDGAVRVLILGEVLHAAITKTYPADKYVGCWFHIACLPGLKQGKRGQYRDYQITEIGAPSRRSASLEAAPAAA